MRASIDVYVRGESWAHRADPRVKLLFVASALLLLLVFRNLILMLAAAVLIHLIHLSAGIPLRRSLSVWRTLLPISLLMGLLRMVFYPEGPPILSFWVIQITAIGVAQGAVLALRLNAMALVIFAWLYTTDSPAVVRSLVKLRLPYEWGLVLALALRYIPTLQGTYRTIAEAQQARALRIEGSGFRRVRTLMPVLVPTIISALRASEQLSRALDARAFGAPGVARTAYRDIRYRTLDWVFTFAIAGLTAVALYLALRHGFGAHPLSLFA